MNNINNYETFNQNISIKISPGGKQSSTQSGQKVMQKHSDISSMAAKDTDYFNIAQLLHENNSTGNVSLHNN